MYIKQQFTLEGDYTITESSLLKIRQVMAQVVDSHNRRRIVSEDTRRDAESIKNAIDTATQIKE